MSRTATTIAFWSANSFTDDQYSQTAITKIGSWPGVIVRADGILDRFYLGVLDAPNEYRIYRRWDGGYYLLATGTAETWRSRRRVSARRNRERQSCDGDALPQGHATLAWTSSSNAEVKTGRKPRDWNLFAERPGFNTG